MKDKPPMTRAELYQALDEILRLLEQNPTTAKGSLESVRVRLRQSVLGEQPADTFQKIF
jgi:hypothetical protein